MDKNDLNICVKVCGLFLPPVPFRRCKSDPMTFFHMAWPNYFFSLIVDPGEKQKKMWSLIYLLERELVIRIFETNINQIRVCNRRKFQAQLKKITLFNVKSFIKRMLCDC